MIFHNITDFPIFDQVNAALMNIYSFEVKKTKVVLGAAIVPAINCISKLWFV